MARVLLEMEQFPNPYLDSPQCIAPNSIYQPTENPESAIYGAVYSGVPVYEMMCRNVAVMRRKEDSYLNATQILKVAGIDKGRRTKILEKEIINGQHEKVQGGYGKYQGTWIPFQRGCQLAAQFNVDTQLAPILTFIPPSPGTLDSTPSKEQVLASSNKGGTNLGKHKRAEKNSPDTNTTRKGRKKSMAHAENNENHFVYPVKAQEVIPGSGERHRATLMAMFLSDSPLTIPDILVSPHPILDLDVNIVIDDQGHTAIHWAAALARVDILRLLIAKGGDIMRVNFNNESALIRAVLVTNNFDSQTFPELLNLLAPSLHLLDSSRRTVLHHIAQVASNKGRGAATRYYMECILEYVAKHGGSFSSFIDAVDVHGDTALNLAARIGARNLVDQLMDVGANSEIENLAGLNPSSFGFTRFNDAISSSNPSRTSELIQYQNNSPAGQIKDGFSLSTRVVFPSIATGNEQDHNRDNIRNSAVPSPLEETQSQLRDLTKELVDLRKQNDLLREQNRKIPELEEKIRVLSEGLEEEISRRATAPLSASERGLQAITHEIHHDGSIESLLNEITVLKANLVSKEALEQELRRELVSVKSCTDSQEFKCKQIIAACVGVPIENVEALLDPLFRAIESDDPVDVMDMNQMASFMNRVKEHDKDLIK